MGMGDRDEAGECGGVGINGQVERVRLIVSRRINTGDEEKRFLSTDDDEGDTQTQWPNDVIVLIIVNRKEINDKEEEISFKRSESFNKRLLLS